MKRNTKKSGHLHASVVIDPVSSGKVNIKIRFYCNRLLFPVTAGRFLIKPTTCEVTATEEFPGSTKKPRCNSPRCQRANKFFLILGVIPGGQKLIWKSFRSLVVRVKRTKKPRELVSNVRSWAVRLAKEPNLQWLRNWRLLPRLRSAQSFVALFKASWLCMRLVLASLLHLINTLLRHFS